MGRQFEPGRAVEVISPKYGSAYQIGGRLVLTAAHLLGEVGSDCRVRAKQSFGEVAATVVWRAKTADIALIELTESVPMAEPVVLGRLPEGSMGQKIGFQMYGYPLWGRTQRGEGKSAAGGRQIEGIIYLADRSPDGLLVLEAQRLPPEGRTERSQWEGASGAAIVCDGLVVAVQSQHQNPNRPASLDAASLWTVYGDEQWCDLLRRHNIDPEPTIARVAGGETASLSNLDPSYHPNNLRNRGIKQQDFFGREADYRALHELMQEAGSSGLAAIIGMPGVGKSELAIQYGRSQRETYRGGVAWFSAANFGEELRDWMQAEFYPDRDLRHLPNLTQQVALGWKEWQSFCGGRLALVIVDDVTDYRQQVEPYLPPVMTEVFPFRILLTSRAHLVSSLSISTLELQELDPDTAVAMLTRFAGASRIDADISTAASICQRLAYLPLAIALVGCWLSIDVDRSLNDLMASLEQEGLAAPALEYDPQVVRLTAERGVMAAFAVSWQQAGAMNPDVQQLARVLTLFAPVDIAWELVLATVQTYLQLYPPALEESKPQQEVIRRPRGWRRWWQWLCQRIQQWIRKPSSRRPLPHASKTINGALEARGTLLRLNLLQRIDGEKHYYRLHPLLREYFTKQWNECDQEGWNLAFAEAIGAWVKTVPGEMTWEQAAAYQDLQPQLPIAQQILQRRVETAPDPETMNRYRTKGENIRGVIFRLSRPVLFEATFEQARKTHAQAQAAAAQGNVSLSGQKFAKALEEYRRVVEQARATFPANSLQLAGYLKQLASLFLELGRYQDGIPPATEALSIVEEYLRPTRLAGYLNTLGMLHYYQGNYVEALPLFQRALAIRERALGGNHTDTATSLNNLAQLYKAMGRYEAALPLYERALAINEQELGGNHTDTAGSLNNLAELYKAMGRYEAALPLLERALAINEQELGSNHPATATSLNNLAGLYRAMERYEAALPLLERALAIHERVLGGNHPDTASSLNNLAELYKATGRYEAALPLYQRALAIYERALGGNHPDTASSLSNLAQLYNSMGQYGDAEELYIKSLAICTEVLGETNPITQKVIGNFQAFLQEVVEAERVEELSDHSLTQATLNEIRGQ